MYILYNTIKKAAQCYSVAKVHTETTCLASEQAHSFTNLLNYVQVI